MASLYFSALSSVFGTTDEQAMWRVQNEDDHHAFARLVDRWEEPIHRLCTRMIGDPHRGEDLTQDTFARLFDRRKQYQPTKRFSTYLWRIALNVCYDELRKVRRRGEQALDDESPDVREAMASASDESVAPDSQVAQAEEGELVRRALLQLPEIYRAVLILRHYERMKLSRIAEVLEIPAGTVHSRMAEGLARLTRILEPQFENTPSREPLRSKTKNMQENLVV